MENITRGERVRQYVVEALASGDKWRKVCEGVSIGHKRIQQFDPVKSAKVRLRISKSVAKPIIRNLAVYDVT